MKFTKLLVQNFVLGLFLALSLSPASVWAQSAPLAKPSAGIPYDKPKGGDLDQGQALLRNARTSPFINLQAIKAKLNFTPYYNLVPTHRVKIAIFDRGFDGYESQVGKTLPRNTYFHPSPVEDDGASTDHGKYMAQIIYGLMTDEGRAPEYTPEFHFYKTWGFHNFQAAITSAIGQKVDLIVHSEVWDYGGNFDGHGLFNAEVDRATNAGITWINAAGNYAQLTYNAPIVTLTDGWVQLPEDQTKLGLRCQSASGICNLRLVLSWNDFKDDVNIGTNKDLDFALFDDLGTMQGVSEHRQVAQGPINDAKGESLYPREIISTDLKNGHYYIRIKNHSNNFTAQDHLRVTGVGEGVSFDHTEVAESLLNPADNPNVITVGALDTERTSVSVTLRKPELLVNSSTKLDVGVEYRGSSQSAAIVAAGFGVMRSLIANMDRNSFLLLVSAPSTSVHMVPTLTTGDLGFTGTGAGGCFNRVQAQTVSYLAPALQKGGVIVETTSGYKIMVDFNPIAFIPDQRLHNPNDMIVATEAGFEVIPRASQAKLSVAEIEVFQSPRDNWFCGETRPYPALATPRMNSPFSLPNID